MGATLTLSSTTTTSITVSYSFTAQSPAITKVTCYCEEYNPTGTVYTAKQYSISSTTSYSSSVTWTGLASNRQHKLYVRSYSSTGALVSTTNILYPYTNAVVTTPSDDHGDSISSATTVSMSSSTGNGSVSGKLETGGDVDYFKFTVPSGMGGKYHIYTSSSIDTKGYLYNSSGTQLAYNDDNTSIASGSNFGIEYTLSSSTTYYVKVQGYSTSTTGSYTLYITRQVTDDHGNSISTATTMSLSSSTGSGSISGQIETGGDVDYFKFTVPSGKGGKYWIYTSSSIDTKGYLYNSSGSQLAYNDDNTSIASGNNFGIEYTLTASTTYYVQVCGYSSSTTGSYTLYVSRQVTDDHGNTPTTATVITLPSAGSTKTYSGSIEESQDVDYFKFTTSIAGTYKFYTTGSLDTIGYLYDSSLSQIAYNDDNSSMGGSTNFGFEASLSAGAVYYLQVRAYSTNTGSYTLNITAPSLPSAMGTITVGTRTTTSIQVLWSSVAGATNYCLEVYKYNTTTLVKSDYSIASSQTSYTITGLTANTSYDIKMYPKNSVGNGTYTKITNISTLDGLPATPANFRVTVPQLTDGFHTLWDSATDATSYSIEAYHASTNALAYSNYNVTTTSHQITGLNEYVTYNLKLWAKNQYGNSTAVWLNAQRTKDGTPPVINFNSTDGKGKVYASWSATDAHSGIRNTSKFSVYIGTANGASSTMVHKQYTDNYYFTFTSDASGNEFVHGAKYWIKVYAYDNEGNSGMTSAQITYTRARPNNWSWTTSKVAGQTLVVTATEWNSLCTRINQFRQYKGLDNYSFTTVSKGDVITATVVNQARTAIASMTTTGLPSTVSKGTKITASFFNNLVSALNGIE